MTFEELLNDEEFIHQYSSASNVQEVVSLFAGKGIEVSREVAQEVFDRTTDAELSADDLDGVSGGISQTAAKAIAYQLQYLYYRCKGYSVSQAKALASRSVYSVCK